MTLVAGDSRQTVPAFLREHPDLYFDLIAIDGGKSTSIVSSDYVNALPRLKVGGVLVSDDMNLAPHLRRIWQTMIRDDARYVTWEFAEGTVGVSAAVRMADEPVLPSLFQPE
ncbi:MAG: class I SAM-dependent methyltransferase [Chloroflexi bacterium]|nr:class I SAM-dependent methyltransferase [Chloroflexota bacterium]